jgi:putative DNA primase/helicase
MAMIQNENKYWTGYDIVIPVPGDAPDPPKTRRVKIDDVWKSFPLSHLWSYNNSAGQVINYVCRYENEYGKKETPPITLWRKGTSLKWRFSGLQNQRPLYNLHRFDKYPGAQMVVVEGEKCAELLQGLVDSASAHEKIIVTTWQGGCRAVSKTDWSPVQNRKTILWPDFDQKFYPEEHPRHGEILPQSEQVGFVAMLWIGNVLSLQTNEVKIVGFPENKPDGWDVGDAILNDGWDFQTIFKFIKNNLTDYITVANESPDPMPNRESVETLPEGAITPVASRETSEEEPFRFLGYDHEFYYYLPSCTRLIKRIRGESHNKASLNTIAPTTYWERNYPGQTGPAYGIAANHLMRANEKRGMYDVGKIRGRGAWFDRGRAVLHIGDRLLVDGVDTEIKSFETEYIYERGIDIEYAPVKKLSNVDSVKLVSVLEKINWRSPVQSRLLAGWCVIAPICGALKWRPHIWITGSAGTGKTYVLDEIVKPCLGDSVLFAQSATTEAGLRQTMKSDALPIMIDEFEAESPEDIKNIQKILELARQSSSDTGARIIKGSVGGLASSYLIRSMFLLSSVDINISRHADESRITVLTLEKQHNKTSDEKADHFRDLNLLVSETITEQFCAELRARIVALIPVIRENAKIFSRAVSLCLGNARTGDQIGTLLAGAYSLYSTNVITPAGALKWVEEQNWQDSVCDVEQDGGDELRCAQHILSYTVRINGNEKSLQQLILDSKSDSLSDPNPENEDKIPPGHTDKVLREYGIRYIKSEDRVYFASYNPNIQKILEKTQWQKSYYAQLKRIRGAVSKRCMRFIMNPTKAVGIDWFRLFGDLKVEASGF